MNHLPQTIARNKSQFLQVSVVALLFIVAIAQTVASVRAATFTETYIRLDRLAESTATGGTVCAQTASSATEASLDITFPSGFTVNGTAGNWTVTTTGLPAGSTAWPGINTATAVSGQTVTFPSSTLTPGTFYCFNFSGTSTLTTGVAGSDQTGTIVTRTGASAEIDSTTFALAVITDDQILITAAVSPTFSFALSGNTIDMGTLSSSSVTSGTGRTVTVTTNAASGWITWVKSSNAALSSTVANYSIDTAGTIDASPSTLSAGTEGYVLDTDLTTDSSGGGTVTISGEYNGTTTSQGGTLSTSFQPVATANGTANGDVITLIPRAAIAGQTPAASDYTDILTVVGAGRF